MVFLMVGVSCNKSFDCESAVYLCSDLALMSMGLMFFFFLDYFIGWWELAANPKWIILKRAHIHTHTLPILYTQTQLTSIWQVFIHLESGPY